MIQETIDWIISNPGLVLLALYLCYMIYQRNQPFPDEKGGPENVNDINEWKQLLADSGQKCKFLFATRIHFTVTVIATPGTLLMKDHFFLLCSLI